MCLVASQKSSCVVYICIATFVYIQFVFNTIAYCMCFFMYYSVSIRFAR